MDRSFLSLNFPNAITVSLMALMGYALLVGTVALLKKWSPSGSVADG